MLNATTQTEIEPESSTYHSHIKCLTPQNISKFGLG